MVLMRQQTPGIQRHRKTAPMLSVTFRPYGLHDIQTRDLVCAQEEFHTSYVQQFEEEIF